MDLKPIVTDEDHDAAVAEIERLWNAPEGSPEEAKMDALATLVDAYERRNFPTSASDPVDLLHYAIAEMGRSQSDLARILGSRPKASEILHRKRALTIDMIDAIAREWHLPVALLAKPYPVEPRGTRSREVA